uniref:Uncharacterized protein n=1 Tax=Aegilops tauschii subsp. strangulata TaxID=200361 RepID=A0A452XSR8_AEGTS
MDMDPDKRPTAFEIIQRLDETESTDYSVSSGHAPPLWQPGDEESDSSDVDASELERTPSNDILPSDEEPTSADTTGETSTQEHNMCAVVSKLSGSAELSSLDFLERITDGFSYERIVGKDSLDADYHKAFVYEVEQW